MAPPHSAWVPDTTLGLTLKVLSQRPKWGRTRRKASHTTIKRRDVEDEVRGQIVEIQAVVEHEPPDKWVKWKAQSAEEVGKKNYPLMGPWGGEKLPLLGKPVRDVLGQVSGLP